VGGLIGGGVAIPCILGTPAGYAACTSASVPTGVAIGAGVGSSLGAGICILTSDTVAPEEAAASKAGEDVITDGEKPKEGQKEIDNTEKGRKVRGVIEDAAAAAGVKPTKTQDGQPTVVFPDGSRATGYPKSTSGNQPSIELRYPSGKLKVKSRESGF